MGWSITKGPDGTPLGLPADPYAAREAEEGGRQLSHVAIQGWSATVHSSGRRSPFTLAGGGRVALGQLTLNPLVVRHIVLVLDGPNYLRLGVAHHLALA